MKAWQVERITEAGDVRLVDLPDLIPNPRQYLVKVEAAGLNFLDTLVVQGRYQTKPPLPFVPGVEIVGRIEAAGTMQDALPAGTRIASSVPFGGFAEYALCAPADAVAIGEDLPSGAAMALRGNYPTSLYALLHGARLQPGETLLVHAGAGGVGSAAVELGKLMGARVIATAGGADKAALCGTLGADEAVDYRDEDWVAQVKRLAPGGVDVVYDAVGGAVGEQSLHLLGYGARYLIIGFAGGVTSLAANRLLLQNASAIGILWGVVRARQPDLACKLVNACVGWYREGHLRPLASQSFPFAQAPEALDALRRRQTTGKALLVM